MKRVAGFLLFLLLFPAGGCGPGGSKSTDGSGRGYGSTGAAPAESAGAPIPGSLPELWNAIASEKAAIDSAVLAESATPTAAHSRRLRALFHGLEPLSGLYVSTRQGPLTDAVRRVSESSRKVEEAAPNGQWDVAKAEIVRLDQVIDFTRGLYPPGVLPDPTTRRR